jgi:hypothetical protein
MHFDKERYYIAVRRKYIVNCDCGEVLFHPADEPIITCAKCKLSSRLEWLHADHKIRTQTDS